MIYNGKTLIDSAPMTPMFDTKKKFNGVSHGLSEAGYDIRIAQDICLHPFSRFKLASSVEKFKLPNNLVAILHDKSSLIRQGLMVGNTVLEPGWEGYLTLELFYHGWKPLRLKSGQGIGQLIFHELTEPSNYSGKYQHQPNRPVASIKS